VSAKKIAVPVTPAKAGVQKRLKRLAAGFHRNDEFGVFLAFTVSPISASQKVCHNGG
jgi:hypothetical protein